MYINRNKYKIPVVLDNDLNEGGGERLSVKADASGPDFS